MSEADRMFFEGLGYEKIEENDLMVRYLYADRETDSGQVIQEQIFFNKLTKEVAHYDCIKRKYLSFYADDMKAVYMKMQELGWIKE